MNEKAEYVSPDTKYTVLKILKYCMGTQVCPKIDFNQKLVVSPRTIQWSVVKFLALINSNGNLAGIKTATWAKGQAKQKMEFQQK